MSDVSRVVGAAGVALVGLGVALYAGSGRPPSVPAQAQEVVGPGPGLAQLDGRVAASMCRGAQREHDGREKALERCRQGCAGGLLTERPVDTELRIRRELAQAVDAELRLCGCSEACRPEEFGFVVEAPGRLVCDCVRYPGGTSRRFTGPLPKHRHPEDLR